MYKTTFWPFFASWDAPVTVILKIIDTRNIIGSYALRLIRQGVTTFNLMIVAHSRIMVTIIVTIIVVGDTLKEILSYTVRWSTLSNSH